MEVPERVLTASTPLIQVEVMCDPGAKISMGAPWLEKDDLTSLKEEAPTVMTSATRAGEMLLASVLLFPAATTTVTPEL